MSLETSFEGLCLILSIYWPFDSELVIQYNTPASCSCHHAFSALTDYLTSLTSSQFKPFLPLSYFFRLFYHSKRNKINTDVHLEHSLSHV